MTAKQTTSNSPNQKLGTLKIAGATLNQTPLDWAHNTQNIIGAIERARKEKVQILCLPELCIPGYGCEDLFLSDWLSEKAWEELQKIKSYCKEIIVCIGLPVRFNSITYNGVCVISNGKILGITLKQNLAIDGVHYETRWFQEWIPEKIIELERGSEKIQTGDLIYEAHGITFGFEICEDAWIKNRPGYNLSKRGVNLILNPSASHFSLEKSLIREKLITDSSVTFNCAYLYVNLLGNEAGRMIYDGDIILAHDGKLLAQNNRLSFQSLNLLTYDFDFQNLSNNKPQKFTDNKEKNEELAQAASLALYDYLRKSKAKGFALSLSGGADSSMCAVLVVEMIKRASRSLGWDAFCKSIGQDPKSFKEETATSKLLTCAYQAARNSSDTTLHAAQQLAQSIGAEFHHWSIQDAVDGYIQKIEKALQRKTTWETDDISLQNIQARSRSPIIWMLANIKQAILLTTSNRSEGDVGYATMDGDTSGSLAPIAGIDKTLILQWLKWAEKNLGYTGLHAVNSLQPTAELRPLERHQTDEADLMPYSILKEIERHAIMERKSPTQVFHAMLPNHSDRQQLKNYIKKFFKLWSANQWKRERFAPAFHLDELNVDPRTWCRFPILSSGFAEELAALDSL
ncbi:MAG TPA: NAD(+) synthase [Cyclobacteriaceae bacterium]|nr:NAD(+) synthase [Cyclobacteriaceae bacterium]